MGFGDLSVLENLSDEEEIWWERACLAGIPDHLHKVERFQASSNSIRQLVCQASTLAPRGLIADLNSNRELGTELVIGGVTIPFVVDRLQIGAIILGSIEVVPPQSHSRPHWLRTIFLGLLQIIRADVI